MPARGHDHERAVAGGSTAPGAARSGRLLTNVTLTSPRSPCARPMRPTSSVARRGRHGHSAMSTLAFTPSALPAARDDLAQRLDHAAAAADEPAHVVGVRVHEQRDLAAAPLLDLDLDRVGIVGEVAGDVLGDRSARAPTMRLPSPPTSSS